MAAFTMRLVDSLTSFLHIRNLPNRDASEIHIPEPGRRNPENGPSTVQPNVIHLDVQLAKDLLIGSFRLPACSDINALPL